MSVYVYFKSEILPSKVVARSDIARVEATTFFKSIYFLRKN